MKIHIIVNPRAGRQTVQKNLEQIVGRLVLDGTATDVRVTRTGGGNEATEAAAACTAADTDLILGCGGDGTINEIVNGLMRSGSQVPLAILAAGTSNDFAYSLRLPDDPTAFCRMIRDGQYREVDIGLANEDTYFVNVASFGMFTDVSHTTDRSAKNSIGRLAYYLKAASSAPEQFEKCAQLNVYTDSGQFSGEYALCLVSNSMSVGSFRRLMHKADVSDGLFDVLMLKKLSLLPTPPNSHDNELAGSGELFKPTALTYFQTSAIRFECTDDSAVEIDLDGEGYGRLPLSIRVCHNALRLLVPKEQENRLSLPLLG